MSQQTSTIPADIELAAATTPYPYAAPLAKHTKAAHLAAIALWQRRITKFTVLTYLPAVIVMVSPRVLNNLHVAQSVLWTLFVIGGLGAIASGIPLWRKVQAKKRHINLLKAYGVELDRNGRER